MTLTLRRLLSETWVLFGTAALVVGFARTPLAATAATQCGQVITGAGLISFAQNTIIKCSTLTGNGLDDQQPGCGDIRGLAAPRIDAASNCDTSVDATTGGTWGVCALD